MTNFSELVNPDILTTELSILLIGMIVVYSFIGIKLRSPATMAGVSLSLVVLIVAFLTSLSFLWFWIMIIITAFVVIASAIAKFVL